MCLFSSFVIYNDLMDYFEMSVAYMGIVCSQRVTRDPFHILYLRKSKGIF